MILLSKSNLIMCFVTVIFNSSFLLLSVREANAGWFGYDSYAECVREEKAELMTRWTDSHPASREAARARRMVGRARIGSFIGRIESGL